MRIIIALLLSLLFTPAYAESIIVPYAPGGPADVIVRNIMKTAPNLTIEYVPGGAAIIGMQRFTQRQKALIIIGNDPLEQGRIRAPESFPHDILNVSRKVATFDGAYMVMLINKDIPFGSRTPVIIGTSAPGSSSSIATDKVCANIECIKVPYQSSGRMITDLIRGEIHAMIALYSIMSGIVGDNTTIVPYAILGPSRDGIPSYPGVEHKTSMYILAKGYSDAEIQKLRSLIQINPNDVGFDRLILED